MDDTYISWDYIYDIDIEAKGGGGLKVWIMKGESRTMGQFLIFFGKGDVRQYDDDHTPDGADSKAIYITIVEKVANDANEKYSEDDYHSLQSSKYTCSGGSDINQVGHMEGLIYMKDLDNPIIDMRRKFKDVKEFQFCLKQQSIKFNFKETVQYQVQL